MTPLVTNFNLIISVLVVLGQIYTVLLLIALLFERFSNKEIGLLKFVGKNAIWLTFLAPVAAMFSSLFYSDVIGYAACTLCWYQRIAMYPLVVLLPIGFFLKDKKVFDYTLGLATVGIVIGIYQYLMQSGLAPTIECAVGGEGGCNERFVNMFGYITIPLMAVTGFAMVIVTALAGRKYYK